MNDGTTPTANRVDWLLFILLGFFWGSSYLFIKIAADAGVEPLTIVTLRLAIGFAVVAVLAVATRERLPRTSSTYGHLLVLALLSMAIPFSLISWAEQSVDSALAAAINGAIPLFVIVIAAAVLPDEPFTLRRAAGLLTGFVGVALLVGFDPGVLAGTSTIEVLALLGSTVSYAAGGVYARRFLRDLRPRVVTSFELMVGWLRGLAVGQVLETAIALAIAAVPEGLPAVATITLALGVHRMARRNAIVRRLPSVETLGAATVICTDKTGTLTAGEITATVLWIGGREITLEGAGITLDGRFLENDVPIDPLQDPAAAEALRAAALANRADLHRVGTAWRGRGDPTELALLVAAAKAGLHRPALREEWPEISEVPFSSERRWMATVHRNPATGDLHAHVKGAAANVLPLCSRIWLPDGVHELDTTGHARVLAADAALAGRGLRVLAVAAGRVGGAGEPDLRKLEFIGLIGMIDPPAPGVQDTIAKFRQAGIRTVMITGDQQRTAEAVARMLDMVRADDRVLDGVEVDALTDEQLARELPQVAAFSRITPETKLRLVRAYQQSGELVAMIGDGINDAAALRKADIGVAMGQRGTDVAKEAAAVVLQDDRFQTIGVAIEEGRVVFDNIRKFVFYLFSCNLAEVLVLLVAGAAGLPLPLLPLQILWLNIVTDTFPALALAVEPAEPDVMKRPPRDPQHAILSHSFVRSVLWYGALITAATMGAFLLAMQNAPAQAGSAAFMTLAFAQTFHLGTARSRVHVLGGHAFTNRVAFAAVLLVILLQLATVYFPPLARLLRTESLSGDTWLIIGVASVVPAIVGQLARFLAQRNVQADERARFMGRDPNQL